MTAAALVPVPSGLAFRAECPVDLVRVTPPLAAELARVLERFALDAGFTPARPVVVTFRAGIVGHHRVGRAADLYGVGGVGLDVWKRRWDEAMARARAAPPEAARAILDEARRTNLGWRLYRALREHGRWSKPDGFPIQLFGPWTREQGPWTRISDGLLRAHRDHVHVAV